MCTEAGVDIDTATSIALGSMMSTTRANLSVGPPYDGCIYLDNSFDPIQFRLDSDSPLLEKLREAWERLMLDAVTEIQRISRDDPMITAPITGQGSRGRER